MTYIATPEQIAAVEREDEKRALLCEKIKAKYEAKKLEAIEIVAEHNKKREAFKKWAG